MKTIEYLISTMNRENVDFIDNMNIKDNIVIINQTNKKETKIIKKGNQTITFISVNEKGLSKSRNMAIENSNADICVISDDDFKYYNDSSEKILKAYDKHKDADIIAFYYYATGRQQKKFNNKSEKVNYINSLKICSSQITFKRESIERSNIRFNENFGAGADKYKSGEENIFLYECLRKGLKIYIEPVYILEIQEGEENSTWFEGYNKNFFETKGAVYYQMTPKFYWMLILQFAIRKRKIYKNSEITISKAIKYMFDASRDYKKESMKRIYIMGDFITDTGPAIVNKNYYKYLQNYAYVCKSNNKIKRIIDILLKIRKCNVVIISGLSKLQLLGCKMAKKFNKEVIYLMHGYAKIEYETNEIEEQKRVLTDIEDEVLKKADKIVCVSEIFSQLLVKYRPDLKNKVTFVNNGIDNIKISHKKKNEEIFTIITVGGGMKRKNNLNICKAIDKIDSIKIKFIVIGKKDKDGEEISRYKFVDYYDHLPHEEVLKKMEESDLYVQNSYFETFGLSIFESIACGCKILISKNVGALSIIENIDDDMIINNSNDIEEIESKIQKIYKQKDKNVTYIEDWDKHSWKNEAEKLLNLCGDLTNE